MHFFLNLVNDDAQTGKGIIILFCSQSVDTWMFAKNASKNEMPRTNNFAWDCDKVALLTIRHVIMQGITACYILYSDRLVLSVITST